MLQVGIKELKTRLSSYLDRVQAGEDLIVTDRGREVAMIVPMSAERRAVQKLVETGKARWAGGKPKGVSGIRVRGDSVSETLLEERR